MQGLANFAAAVGQIFQILLPTFCYIAALTLFLFAGWGFWRQSQPDNPFRGKPWIPIVSLLFCGVFASFDRFLTLANRSGGSAVTVNLVAGLSSYSAPSTDNMLGSTPADTVINVVQIFQLFFQAFGAMMAFAAMYGLWAVMRGTSRRTPGGCLVQFVFSVMLINVLTISQWVVSFFT
ncbi:hypothetical protein QMO56_21470 [Roseomonas sp. E05]|uniref:hypothetical protein n=1 Tax=Roseomonas sp. E05 TaxID=3046310 RepID=UPI0024B94F7A|nr:hypothetical protein [Roseomonas sp. E05]MDJ0390689.1 hypothetical protein [Roseomonas sp. E05]